MVRLYWIVSLSGSHGILHAYFSISGDYEDGWCCPITVGKYDKRLVEMRVTGAAGERARLLRPKLQ